MKTSNNIEESQTFIADITQLRHTLKKWENADELHWTEELSEKELIQELAQISQLQRFIQWWQADPEFKQQVLIDPHQAAARYNLNINPDTIRLLRNKVSTTGQQASSIPSFLENYRKLINDELRQAHEIQRIANSSTEPRYKAWRKRQMARTASELNQLPQAAPEIHFPVCFELSKGCSVGCWFCGVSAPRLSDIFIYNQENARLWCEVLELIKEILGPAAGAGFCYCASDPFDNPDYEKFCCDFHEVLGIFPATTTAQPLKNPARTRALLKLSLEKGCILNRFSILSLKMLHQVCDEFSSEELAFVDFALQNKEADTLKSNSGRAREYKQIKADKSQEIREDAFAGSTACVSGFLFNMIDRSVKLTSPCNADERWPLGYRVYDEGNFTNADDLKILLERMIDNHMPLTLRSHERVSFRRDLKYESLPDGFQLSTRFHRHKFRNASYMRHLGELIHKGDKTVAEIALLFNVFDIGLDTAHQALNLMFQHGVLDDEPKL